MNARRIYAWYPDFFFLVVAETHTGPRENPSLLLSQMALENPLLPFSHNLLLTRQHVLELLRGLLLRELEELLVGVGVARAVVVLVVVRGSGGGLSGLGLLALLLDEDDRGGALGLGGAAELEARPDEQVGDVVLLAVDGQVHDDLVGRDVAGDDADPGDLVRVGGRLDGRLAERLVHLLDAALEGACFPGCLGRRRTRLAVVIHVAGAGAIATASSAWVTGCVLCESKQITLAWNLPFLMVL